MRIAVLIMAGVFLIASNTLAKTPEEYLAEAGALEAAGNLPGASAALEPALAEHPDNAMILSKAGMYLGMQAGAGGDQSDVISLITRSFDLMDRSVMLEPQNTLVRFQRGVVYVQVPNFLNRYDTGIEDLEFIVSRADAGEIPPDMLVAGLFYLGAGYRTAGRNDDARRVWTQVTVLAPGSPLAQQSNDGIAGLPDSPDVSMTARQILDEIPDIAELNRKLANDPENPELLMALLNALGREAGSYDERTYTDTSFRTLLAMETIAVADRVLTVTNDPEACLACAALYVDMPFFVNRLDRGIDELQQLVESDAPDAVKAQASYMLGCAWQRKATTAWIDAVVLYPRTESAELALQAMYARPASLESVDSTSPAVVVDFDLGFRDELAPQTAVWIENASGDFVRTLYVSGFCGHAREKQVDLPRWSKASEYVDADAVTAASIDSGKHIYTWDCRDAAGKQVAAGNYTVKIECSWWPSMQYERAETMVKVGGAAQTSAAAPGKYIPHLAAKYVPVK